MTELFDHVLREDLTNYSGASNLKFNEKINALKAAGEEIYHFGFGQSPFPVPDPFVKHLKVDLIRKVKDDKNAMPTEKEPQSDDDF